MLLTINVERLHDPYQVHLCSIRYGRINIQIDIRQALLPILAISERRFVLPGLT